MIEQFVDPLAVALILIDVQPFFIDIMYGPQEPVLARQEHLLLLTRHFSIPVIATFEHPVERNGWLPERLARAFPADGRRFVKQTFNLCAEPEIRRAVCDLGVTQIVVAGAETDVCVLQSTLGLIAMGYRVFIVEDCLFTAEPNDGPAIRRMEQAGAIPLTYKMLHYELKRSVETESFHHAWNRACAGEGRYVSPYDLPVFDRGASLAGDGER
jgi:nicotinamidase-related amidase